MKEKALVPISNGSVQLREPRVMEVKLANVPPGVTVVNLQRIGDLSGVLDGRWKSKCDFLLICPTDGVDEAIFVELKKNLSDEDKGKEQLRRSLPYLEYLRSVCRIEHGSATRVSARYVLIGEKLSPLIAKQRVSGGHFVSHGQYLDIKVRMLVGNRLRFGWLWGDPD